MADEPIEAKWMSAGRSAAALLTVALNAEEAEVSEDIDYLRSTLVVIEEMDSVDLAMANAWLARIAVKSLLEQNAGDIESVRDAVREMAKELVVIELDATV